ncbi:YeeE/YedE family protein [Chitinilyticum piscinae]|uniref:YeeE/YedE family protein n=1 Tax=Chitinilyticum piscinae TaxID=2866724 RepID=A0A8J7K8N5_9NEIS|nr:YeeE/YedE family protein [Chitinilyticum piscinae]MBE9609763.1 YeeE/YedE family protein [Chitinilyticum piscinae]
MQIDLINFTPWSALAGGALIGLAGGLLALLSGRIAGISGIVGGLFDGRPAADRNWRIAFVAGLLAAPLLWQLVAPLPAIQQVAGIPAMMIAGLLVGLGTRYANGCTSGHGVCGLSRLSLRSLVAVLSFMGAGFVTVFIIRHVLA